MKNSIEVSWLSNMAFETNINGHSLIMDANPEVGGENKGPRPKPLMLAALGGCTGMDVVSLLKKMRIEISDFKIFIDGEVTDEHPKQFNQIHLIYQFTGKDLPLDKIEHIVRLSQDKYCGVSATYKKAMDVSWEVRVIPI